MSTQQGRNCYHCYRRSRLTYTLKSSNADNSVHVLRHHSEDVQMLPSQFKLRCLSFLSKICLISDRRESNRNWEDEGEEEEKNKEETDEGEVESRAWSIHLGGQL